MKSFRKVLAFALTYIGAIIGAGFASGQELLHFFVRYGYLGLVGTLVAGLGFVVLALAVFRVGVNRGLNSYNQFLHFALGKTMGKVADLCFSLYLFMCLVIMLAGCEAVFAESFGFVQGFGTILSGVILIGALLCREDGVVALNTFLVPLIVFGALLVVVLSWGKTGISPVAINIKPGFAWLGSAVLYVSYNLIGGLVILLRLTRSHSNEGFAGIVLGGLALGFLAGLLSLVLLYNYPALAGKEVPLLVLAENKHVFLGRAYGIVLWFAMLTTAAVNGAALALRAENLKIPYALVILLFILISAVLARMGFSMLIKTIYPFFGWLGLALLASAAFRKGFKRLY